jgi:predicted RNase H-like HicB family nuclease
MESLITIKVEKLPEGYYLATSDEIQGLVAQGRTINETLEIARDVAKKLLESQSEKQREAVIRSPDEEFNYPLVIEL